MNTEARLVSHVDTDIISRGGLALIPTPPSTRTFKPVPHIELVETLEGVLQRRGIQVETERYAVRRDGSALFGVMGLNYGRTDEARAALGLRTANDRTMSVQLVAGLNVFVCDNMALRGDMIALKQRHYGNLSIRQELEAAVDRFVQHFKILEAEVGNLKAMQLTQNEAKAIMFDIFAAGIMPARFLRDVAVQWETPKHEEFAPRTAWSLHNAFTEVAKVMPVTTRMIATQELGRRFGMVGNGQPAPRLIS